MRVAIHGSCVTRDTFSEDYASDVEVSVYVARSAIVSVESAPISEPAVTYDDLGWRHRMGFVDYHKRLYSLLRAADADLLIIDFIDEMYDLARVEGSYFTITPELNEYLASQGLAPMRAAIPQRETFSSTLWMPYLDRYARSVRELFENIVIHEAYHVPWHRRGVFAPREQKRIAVVNRMLWAKYRALKSRIPEARVIPMGLTSADANHKWGLAPYHYESGYYRRFYDRLVG